MASPPGFDPEHLGEQARRLALGDVGQMGRKADRIAALVAGGEVAPPAVESVHLEAAEIAIRPTRVAGDNLSPTVLPCGKSRFNTAGKAARAA
jgi:hypothetical protein